MILKLFRHYQPGPNPDCEIGKYLTETTKFDAIPPFAGSLEYVPESGEQATVAMVQGLVVNEGDGWKWTIEEVERYYETNAPLTFSETLGQKLGNPIDLSEQPRDMQVRDTVGIYLESAATLGRRTAELHRSLASSSDDPAFAAEPFTLADFQTLVVDLRQQAAAVFDVLKS